ncbi:Nramp family divalent metal transporter [Crocinitomix catalasitica]|uniref:Nramp family divalent metal transporter n=1 Tax=Crocinitomix catalasitica TaxID=184607 RepID=UPI00048865B6|nr:Nramp family divalent metal transporter [Crocinitomix catalasitica]
MNFNPFKNIGPATLIAAAFIGPGTITICTLAGVNFGFALLWTMLLSIFGTIILQEMAARLGLIYQSDLASAIRKEIKSPIIRNISIGLIISAIIIGNSAYQGGNISGGVMGLSTLIPNFNANILGHEFNLLLLILSFLAFIILYIGNYKILERILITLVLLMSISFVIAAFITKPDLQLLFKGMFIPSFPEGSLLMILGLIGTTVVPYNLFLHSSIVQKRWSKTSDLRKVRKDTIVSILLGGFVSMAVIIAAASAKGGTVENMADLATTLTPLYGKFANVLLGFGMFAAGLTSAITAPLAAAFVAKGCLGWKGEMKSVQFRSIWIFVLLCGTLIAIIGKKPIAIIYFAQITNALLLPMIVIFLIWVMNRSAIVGKFKNNIYQNFFGALVLFLTLVLLIKTISTFL